MMTIQGCPYLCTRNLVWEGGRDGGEEGRRRPSVNIFSFFIRNNCFEERFYLKF